MDCRCLDARNANFLLYVEGGTVIISGGVTATCMYAAATATAEIAVAFFGFLSIVSGVIFVASLLAICDSSTHDVRSYFENVAKHALELCVNVAIHMCVEITCRAICGGRRY